MGIFYCRHLDRLNDW